MLGTVCNKCIKTCIYSVAPLNRSWFSACCAARPRSCSRVLSLCLCCLSLFSLSVCLSLSHILALCLSLCLSLSLSLPLYMSLCRSLSLSLYLPPFSSALCSPPLSLSRRPLLLPGPHYADARAAPAPPPGLRCVAASFAVSGRGAIRAVHTQAVADVCARMPGVGEAAAPFVAPAPQLAGVPCATTRGGAAPDAGTAALGRRRRLSDARRRVRQRVLCSRPVSPPAPAHSRCARGAARPDSCVSLLVARRSAPCARARAVASVVCQPPLCSECVRCASLPVCASSRTSVTPAARLFGHLARSAVRAAAAL